MKPFTRRALPLALAILLVGGLGLAWWTATDKTVLTGRYLQGENGAHMVIDRRGTPVIMGSRSDAGLFDALTDGDRVLVVCSAVAESYPAQSRAYWCLRLGRGSQSDLPADTLRQLSELGWLSASL